MAKFMQVSENYFVDENYRLISKSNLPVANKNQYVYTPSYISVPNQEIIGFNFFGADAKDTIRNYERVNYVHLRYLQIVFKNMNTFSLKFYNRFERVNHFLDAQIVFVRDLGYRAMKFSTQFRLDDSNSLNSCMIDTIIGIDDFKPIRYNSCCDYAIKCGSYHNKGVDDCIRYLKCSLGLNDKDFIIKYKNLVLPKRYKIFFLQTFGIILNDDLSLAAIVTFDKYNNNEVGIDNWIYLADGKISRFLLLSTNSNK